MKNILIVEDEPDFAALLEHRVASAGYTADVAGDAVLALESLRRKKPDLIILDLVLPGDDGLSVLKEVRRSGHTKEIPVIISTAKQGEEYKALVLKEGISAYFQKPFESSQMLEEIAKSIL